MMPSENERDAADTLSRFLQDVINLAEPPQIPARFASVDSAQALYAKLLSLREFLLATSQGDLSKQVALKGYIGGTLKTLQANLKHMTWQTKMVASGDFSQRVEFMGEFSQSFNAMVIQLDRTLQELVRKEVELSKVNRELLQEVAIRKQTESVIRKNEEAMRLLAITDGLTDLYNRRHFNKLAEDEIGRALRYARPLSLIMVDIDFFKRINDTFGHSVGDRVLQRIAIIIKEMVRVSDIPARYGGEEFVILLPETPVAVAAGIAERLKYKIEGTTLQAGEDVIRVTASFGVNDFFSITNDQSHERILSELVANADQALYASKNAGRNRVTVYKTNNIPLR
ncbi:MAG: GGDEF domain-containing protein [Pseudomonadota bacterium]